MTQVEAAELSTFHAPGSHSLRKVKPKRLPGVSREAFSAGEAPLGGWGSREVEAARGKLATSLPAEQLFPAPAKRPADSEGCLDSRQNKRARARAFQAEVLAGGPFRPRPTSPPPRQREEALPFASTYQTRGGIYTPLSSRPFGSSFPRPPYA